MLSKLKAMFTGIIEELGSIVGYKAHTKGALIRIGASVVTADTAEGDSISVNGVCLTALNVSPDSFEADVSQETLDRSSLGALKTGSDVNLERALTMSSRLGGHIVQGHVDGTGKFAGANREGEFWTVRVSFPEELGRYMVHKGSICVDGISLTIAALRTDSIEIAVIPKTWEMTNLSRLEKGNSVNLEVDVIAKYVERIMTYREAGVDEGITVEQLKKLGIA